jgi:hypothetical protein
MFGALSVFVRRIKGMVRLQPEQVWTGNVTRHHYLLLSLVFIRDASVWIGANLLCCAVS